MTSTMSETEQPNATSTTGGLGMRSRSSVTSMTSATSMTSRAVPPARPRPDDLDRGTRGDRGDRNDGWTDLIEEVRQSGQYPTTSEAERVTRIVLSALGGHVTGDERVDLARALPERAARLIAAQIPAIRPLTAAEFVDAVATRIEGATPATARWDVSSVLSVLPKRVGDDLVDRILSQLPSGYALLFGRAELAPAG